MRFRAILLGSFSLLVGGQSVHLPSKAKEIIAYVAIRPSKRARRQRIAGALWPDTSDERAMANLSTSLWRLRKAVLPYASPDFIAGSDEEIALDPDRVGVDSWEFEERARGFLADYNDISNATRAIELYGGDLLDGEYDAVWLMNERERLRLLYLSVLRAQAQVQVRNGELNQAAATYERLVQEDPTDEPVCREMMKLYASKGNRAEALRIYDVASKRLLSDLGVTPEVETSALRDVIKQGHYAQLRASPNGVQIPTASVGNQLEMVGRDHEMEELNDALRQIVSGRPLVVGVEGEAGIGKTRLMMEFAQKVSARGYRLLSAACDQIPNVEPYGIFRRLFETSSSPLEVWPKLAERDSTRTSRIDSESRVRFFESVASWFVEQATSSPVVVIVDDLQLADAASLDLLAYLSPRMGHVKLLIVLAWRPEECPARVLRFVGPRGIVHKTIQLSRLAELEVQRLCAAFFGGTGSAFRVGSFVFRESEGNPLFVIEILRSLTEGQSMPPHPLGNSHRKMPNTRRQNAVPAGIRSAVERRIKRLPHASGRLLQVASTSGRKIDLDLMMKFLAFSREEILVQMETLVKCGFVVGSGDSFEFAHDKIRLLCYEELSPLTKLRIHRGILMLLEVLYPERLDELAFHSESSGDSKKAAAYWERIGDRAISLWAHRDAVSAYTRALEHLRIAGPSQIQFDTQFELLRKRASGWELLGEIERGEEDIQEMLETAGKVDDKSKRCQALTVQSRLLLRRGYYHQASLRAKEALSLSRDLVDSALEAKAQEALAHSLYRSSDDEEAHRMFLQLVPLLEKAGDYESLERIWNRIASLRAGQGDSAALADLDNAERFSVGNLKERGFRHLLRGVILTHMAQGEDARISLEMAEEDYRRCDDPSGQALANCFLAVVHGGNGHVALALKHARQGLPLRAGKMDVHWRVISSTNLGHGLFLGLGSFKMTRRMIFRALRFLPQVEGRGKGNLLDLAAMTALEEGDLESSQALVSAALREVADYPGICKGEFLLTLGRIKLALGLASEAAGVLREAVAILETGFNHVDLTQALSCLAIALKKTGSSDEASKWSERAIAFLNSRGGFGHRPQEVYWNHFLVMQGYKERVAFHALGEAHRVVAMRAKQLGRRLQERYLAMPLNRTIVETWAKTLGSGQALQSFLPESIGRSAAKDCGARIVATIPRTGARWGRPLRTDELVEIIWTVDAGRQDENLKELRGEIGLRRARILRLCAEANVQGGDPREEDLARVLGVSTRTIRTDVAYLRAQGCSLQTRGANLH